ncbi:cytochrome c biogenesis CcdA family protein [Lysobacter sp. ESA13C]|uniref:cytochrome c biogenesis CcdA family protein n=1 Tax=Lysobacter sp. ESA13C TaxID=2862676 RepID=UPI001CBB7C4B
MIALALAALAGMATLLSPCVLPVLPIVLARGAGGDRREPLLIGAGFIGAFAAGGIALGLLASSSGRFEAAVRLAAIAVLLLAGLSCVWPGVFERVQQRWLAGSRLLAWQPRAAGPGGALLVGVSLGIAWTPCAGPVLASVLALAAGAQDPARASALLGMYALGAAVPLLAFVYGGRWVAARMASLQRHSAWLRRAFGVVAVAMALLQLAQLDTALVAWLLPWLPSISTGL